VVHKNEQKLSNRVCDISAISNNVMSDLGFNHIINCINHFVGIITICSEHKLVVDVVAEPEGVGGKPPDIDEQSGKHRTRHRFLGFYWHNQDCFILRFANLHISPQTGNFSKRDKITTLKIWSFRKNAVTLRVVLRLILESRRE